VDVRSPHAGVLKAYHAALNDTVAVGAALCTLDTDASAAASSSSSSSSSSSAAAPPTPSAAIPAAQAPKAPTLPAPSPPSAAQLLHRKPSILFKYGVRSSSCSGSGSASSGGSAYQAGDFTATLEALYPSKKGALPELSLGPSFGRPALSGDQAFLIFSGGAYGEPPPALPAGGKAKK